jgi:hypothetical protein
MSNERLQRVLAIRHLGGAKGIAIACSRDDSTLLNDLRLFALTFAGGFLFTSIFIA